jgi:hypothetical protein
LTSRVRNWLNSFGYPYDVNDLDFVFGIEFDRKTKSQTTELEDGKEVLLEIPFQLTQWCFTG